MFNALAQYTTVNTSTDDSSWFALGGMMIVVWLAVLIVVVAGMWKTFEKAKKPGWAAIVPIYNYIVLLQIAGRPVWWVFLMLLAIIPFVGWIVPFILSIVVSNDIAKSFGKDIGTTLLLVFLPIVGWPYLGFGDAKYKGPSGPAKS